VKLNNRQELAALREACQAAKSKEKRKILVCTGTGCMASGAMDIYERLLSLMESKKIPCSVELKKDPHSDDIRVTKGGCPGFCEMGPLVRIEPQGWLYTKVKVEDCEDIIDQTIVKGELVERLAYKLNGKVYLGVGAGASITIDGCIVLICIYIA